MRLGKGGASLVELFRKGGLLQAELRALLESLHSFSAPLTYRVQGKQLTI